MASVAVYTSNVSSSVLGASVVSSLLCHVVRWSKWTQKLGAHKECPAEICCAIFSRTMFTLTKQRSYKNSEIKNGE